MDNRYGDSVVNEDNNLIYKYYASTNSFDALENNSAVMKLFDVFSRILNADGGRYNQLCKSVDLMKGVSSVLKSNNSKLGSSWEEAANSCGKMEDKISGIIIEMVKEVNAYIEATYSEETAITKTTQEFNNSMDTINKGLDDLDNL